MARSPQLYRLARFVGTEAGVENLLHLRAAGEIRFIGLAGADGGHKALVIVRRGFDLDGFPFAGVQVPPTTNPVAL